MHRHVDDASFDVDLVNLANEHRDVTRELHAARWNSSEHDPFRMRISLDDFVRNPPQRAANGLRVHDRDGGRWILFSWFHTIPWRPHRIALKGTAMGISPSSYLSFAFPHPFFTPIGAMFHDPIEQCFLKADVFAGFFAFDPLVLQNLGALGKELFVESRILNESSLIFFRRHHLGFFFHIICTQSTKSSYWHSTGQPVLYLSPAALAAADASLRQSFTDSCGDLSELGSHERLSVFAGNRDAAIARFARSDIDRDLTEQGDPQPLRFAFAAAASENVVAFAVR